MRHVEDVEKKGTYTTKQAAKHKQKPKNNATHKPSCAASETSTSRKEKTAHKSIPATVERTKGG
jgi:hypothetical protein